jgi:DNA-binding winged helix-turn-helix (wHTH) protein
VKNNEPVAGGTASPAALSATKVYRCGNLEIDPDKLEIRRDREVISAEPKVYNLLLYLVRHQDRVVSKQELFDGIWAGLTVSESALTRCVSLARRAAGRAAKIRNYYGYGYRLIPELTS